MPISKISTNSTIRTCHQKKPINQKLFRKSLLITVIALVAVAQPAVAENQATELDMISVVGQATSGIDSVITTDDLAKTQADDLNDIFKNDASVNVGGSVSMGQKIYVRNIGEDSLNISIDGAEQAGAVFHHAGRISIEPELLKRVEVEAGAGSATAGPGALGGSVRFTTKDPEDLLRNGENVGGSLKSTYFGNAEGSKTSAAVYARNSQETFSTLLNFSGADLEELEDGDGNEIDGTASQKKVGYAKFVANISDAQYLSYSYENFKEKGDVLYRPELIPTSRNAVEPTVAKRNTHILNYGFDPSNNKLVNFSLNLYKTEQEQAREFSGTSYDGSVETTGFTVENKSQIHNHQLIYGVNYRDDVSVLNDVDFAPNSFFEEKGTVRGIYVQDIIDVSERLTITTGIRFDEYTLDDVDGLHFNDTGSSPNLSANYKLTTQWNVSAGYAEALRGPEISDSFRLSSYDNDPTLKAEKAKNTELGVDFYGSDFTFSAGIYRSLIDNPIGRSLPWKKVVENLSDAIKTTGYFLSVNKQWDQLNVAASFNSANTKSGGETVTRYTYGSTAISTGDTLVLDVNYDFTPNFSLGWTSEYVKGLHDIDITLGTENLTADKPGYSVHGLYAHWLPTGDEKFELNLAINNLFNKQYLSHGSVEDFTNNAGYESISGSAEAGQDIRLSAAVRF